MKKFYICTTGIAKGPYDISDVDNLDINSNDLIWTNKYFDSRQAIQVPELRAYFKKRQPDGSQGNASRVPGYQKIVLALLLSAVAGMVVYYFAMV